MKGQRKLTAKGAKIVAALERFRDTLESGVPVEQRYTVRKIRLKLTPAPSSPKRSRMCVRRWGSVNQFSVNSSGWTGRLSDRGSRGNEYRPAWPAGSSRRSRLIWNTGGEDSGMSSTSRTALGKNHDNLATSRPIDLLPRRPRITSGRRVAGRSAGPRETHRSHPTNWRPTYLCSRVCDRCQSVFQVRVALLLAVGWRGIQGLFQFCRFCEFQGFYHAWVDLINSV